MHLKSDFDGQGPRYELRYPVLRSEAMFAPCTALSNAIRKSIYLSPFPLKARRKVPLRTKAQLWKRITTTSQRATPLAD
uniref:Transposase n=1 Tax=Steinernema glaseri TaxID=37863 RepID=A0A1I7YK52_9BILA